VPGSALVNRFSKNRSTAFETAIGIWSVSINNDGVGNLANGPSL
jgi:hypothetical protein